MPKDCQGAVLENSLEMVETSFVKKILDNPANKILYILLSFLGRFQK